MHPQLEVPLRGYLNSCRCKLTAPFFFYAARRLPKILESHLEYSRFYFGTPLQYNTEPPFPFAFTVRDAEEEWLPQVSSRWGREARCTRGCGTLTQASIPRERLLWGWPWFRAWRSQIPR